MSPKAQQVVLVDTLCVTQNLTVEGFSCCLCCLNFGGDVVATFLGSTSLGR